MLSKQYLEDVTHAGVWATWDDALPVDERTYRLLYGTGSPIDNSLNANLIHSLYHLIREHETVEIFEEEF